MSSIVILKSGSTHDNQTHYYVDFDPQCNYEAGTWNWQVNVSGSSYYKDNSSQLFTITIIGNTYMNKAKPR